MTRNTPDLIQVHAPAIADLDHARYFRSLGLLRTPLRELRGLRELPSGAGPESGPDDREAVEPRTRPLDLSPLVLLDDVWSLWLQEPLGAAWMVAYRLSLDRGAPVIAEVRVYPREPGFLPGEWSAALLGSGARPPSGGVTTRLLRQVRVGGHYRHAEAVFRALTRLLPDDRDASAVSPTARRGRRSRRPDAWYASLAETYVDALRRGDRAPSRAVADRHFLSREQARVELHVARLRKLLTPVGKSGVRGGDLTPRARQLLARARRGRPGAHRAEEMEKQRRSRPNRKGSPRRAPRQRRTR